jgi:hypothetical protein
MLGLNIQQALLTDFRHGMISESRFPAPLGVLVNGEGRRMEAFASEFG